MTFQRLRSALANTVPALVRDIAGVAGVALVSYGAWLAWQPAGFMVGGALLIAGALLTASDE